MRPSTFVPALGIAVLLALAPQGARAQDSLKDPPQTLVLPPPGPETPADKEQDAGGSGAAVNDPLNEVFQDFTGGCGGPDGGGAGCGPEPDMPPPPQ